jgi:hypothetical protein
MAVHVNPSFTRRRRPAITVLRRMTLLSTQHKNTSLHAARVKKEICWLHMIRLQHTDRYNDSAETAELMLTVRESSVNKWPDWYSPHSVLQCASLTSWNPPNRTNKCVSTLPHVLRKSTQSNSTPHHEDTYLPVITQYAAAYHFHYIANATAKAFQGRITRFSHPRQRVGFNNHWLSKPSIKTITICSKKLATSCH